MSDFILEVKEKKLRVPDGAVPSEKTERIQEKGNSEPKFFMPAAGIGGVQPAAKRSGPFKFPATDGTNNQVMVTDGAGNLSWAAQSGGIDWTNATENLRTTGSISGNTISGNAMRTLEDHSTSGNSAVVGIITHTSATPPTASNYPIGTLYIQYTA